MENESPEVQAAYTNLNNTLESVHNRHITRLSSLIPLDRTLKLEEIQTDIATGIKSMNAWFEYIDPDPGAGGKVLLVMQLRSMGQGWTSDPQREALIPLPALATLSTHSASAALGTSALVRVPEVATTWEEAAKSYATNLRRVIARNTKAPVPYPTSRSGQTLVDTIKYAIDSSRRSIIDAAGGPRPGIGSITVSSAVKGLSDLYPTYYSQEEDFDELFNDANDRSVDVHMVFLLRPTVAYTREAARGVSEVDVRVRADWVNGSNKWSVGDIKVNTAS